MAARVASGPPDARSGPRSVLGVHVLDEARELVRRGPDRPDRLVVVHPDWAEQADCAERSVGQPVARGHESDVLQRRVVQLAADADEWTLRVERLVHELEQRCPLLECLEQAAVDPELIRSDVAEEAGRATD